MSNVQIYKNSENEQPTVNQPEVNSLGQLAASDFKTLFQAYEYARQQETAQLRKELRALQNQPYQPNDNLSELRSALPAQSLASPETSTSAEEESISQRQQGVKQLGLLNRISKLLKNFPATFSAEPHQLAAERDEKRKKQKAA